MRLNRLAAAAALAAVGLLAGCVVQPIPYRYQVVQYPVRVAPPPAPVAVMQPAPAGAVVVAPAPIQEAPPMVEGDATGAVIVDVAPPAPIVEVQGPMPFFGAVWIDGYWGWSGGHHTWVRGRWDHPHPGMVYRPHTWTQSAGHWHLQPGGWAHR